MINQKPKILAAAERPDPYFAIGKRISSDKFWRWGDDNLLPAALALMSRRSTTHRRIINDKADYISGKGFNYDRSNRLLGAFVERVNGAGDSLRQLLNRVAFDKSLFGNAFVEVVTDADHSFLSLYHHDASHCRLARDNGHVLLHHDWAHFNAKEARTLPLYPSFEADEGGLLRAMIHYKDYEPMFSHYGVPPYIAGMNVSAIAYKTDRWNISRLDNSFQLSGVMMLDAGIDDEQTAYDLVRRAEIHYEDIAVVIAPEEGVDRTAVAQAADELLTLKGVRASFVLYPVEEDVMISARSLGEINVQVILEPLGGGGNSTIAGGRVKDADPETVREKLLAVIGDYLKQ